jgi:hypothetical protein
MVLLPEHRGLELGYSAFSRARKVRFRTSDVFWPDKRVVEACIAADLVGGERLAVDAS